MLSWLEWFFYSVGCHPSPLCSTLGVSLELHGPAWCILNSKTILFMNNTHYRMLFKSYSRPHVHLASMLHAIYLLEVLVTLGKLSRWCIRSAQTLAHVHIHTRADKHTITSSQRQRGGPFAPSFLSSAPPPPPLLSWCSYMYYLYACPSLDTDASCFAILNRSNLQGVKQEWIFYALGVTTSKSPL